MNDYSGVATSDIAQFLIRMHIVALEHQTEEHQKDRRDSLLRKLGPSWAKEMNDRNRKLTRIERCEYKFTGLDAADQICYALGVNVSQTFVIIPKPSMITAALRMAEDQYKDEHEQVTVDFETLFARAKELRELGALMLGKLTPEQESKLMQDRARASRSHRARASAALVG